MPLIRSVESTRDRLGFSAEADRDVAFESHLETAVETISDRIRSEITRVDVIDTFFVRFTLRSPIGTGGRKRPATSRNTGIAIAGSSTTQLLLSRGFVVDIGSGMTIFAAGTEDALDDSSVRSDLKSVSSIDHTMIEAERGVVRVQDFGLDGVYVRVSYRAGFLDDGASPAVFTSTPDWLIRANDLETRILVNSDSVFGRDKVEKDEQDRLESRLQNILTKHARYIPTAEKPIHSSETASSI